MRTKNPETQTTYTYIFEKYKFLAEHFIANSKGEATTSNIPFFPRTEGSKQNHKQVQLLKPRQHSPQ